MSVDVFGRQLTSTNGILSRPGPPGVGFKLTNEGNYSLDHKKLCNLAICEGNLDAVPLGFLKDYVQQEINIIKNDLMQDQNHKLAEILEMRFITIEKSIQKISKRLNELIFLLDEKVKKQDSPFPALIITTTSNGFEESNNRGGAS